MHVEIHGRTDAAARTVLLSSGLGGSGSYWAEQIPALTDTFRVVTYDHRGTGRTGGDVPATGGIAAMADDVLDLLDAREIDQVDFVGHALGGLIGLDIALRQPGRIGRLALVNAWSKADPHSGRCFDIRIELLEASGIPAFVKAQPLFLYPAVWMSENADRMAADEAHGIAHFQGKTNLLRRIAALRTFDIDDRLADIGHETLVMASRDDLLVPWTRSQRLADGLPNAILDLVDHGGHAVNIVDPGPFNQRLVQFLAGPNREKVSVS
ncbi:pyrimidine utilization protein D [Rhizobium sp. Leaf341]|uniref:pyrimidine utilization protein D n=1 Tax=Rhizobium sp. Leaf341 TaxID=1736344 RepID=UPI0007153736|nr:pyrimidine utilization protein D [Rhizobium sp. Leaf341]KQR73023.1 pyrimidine utilization protein D [Rhizobium sp. Leaf341]